MLTFLTRNNHVVISKHIHFVEIKEDTGNAGIPGYAGILPA